MPECRHLSIQTYTFDEGEPALWACNDCRLRFYPACKKCISVGHRGVEHITLDEGVDGVDCDWDERGKCRCLAATPAPLLAKVESSDQATLAALAVGVVGQNIVIDCGTHENALRLVANVTLAATPAPLDVTDCDCTPGFPHKAQVAATPAPLDGLRAALEIIVAEPTAAPDAIGVTARNVARHALAATPAEADEDGEYPLRSN